MPVRFATALAAAAAIVVAAPALGQTVLLKDNFNGENGGAGAAEFSGFANFAAPTSTCSRPATSSIYARPPAVAPPASTWKAAATGR